MKGLVIRSPWIELILEGKKSWEIRGSNTKIRGPVVLIKSGSGKVFGEVNIVDSKALSLEDYQTNKKYHCIESEDAVQLPYKKTYAWVIDDPKIYKEPIPYKHPMGAIIWVNLPESIF
ncbi:ASCH domain-containing protein [Aquibacillus koreensis]|uniref:ASCH domain-containing protein n=1 Tax=Aquibacillus koreensis TaxID=279446 RepID=A0A9X3WM06_9BACI|nr:ASCH domain-containing protein [Aquibacillus koreensis]MCT2535367.1 ASCH domain-containing protein [Aquibacillus koreensis]MDC3422532.1 ASCH domain-containing protein [Aquibacillus koreensis]